MGAKKSTVWTSARSSRSTKTPASSKLSRPTSTRGSACEGTPLSACARSPGPSLAAQPAHRAKLVKRKSSSRVGLVDMASGLRVESARASARVDDGNEVDLDEYAARQAGDLDGRAGRPRIAHDARIHLVHLGKVAHVHEEDRRLHDVLPVRTRGPENGGEVAEDLFGLRDDVAGHDLPR